MAQSRFSSHPKVLEVIQQVRKFAQNSFSKTYESERSKRLNVNGVLRQMRREAHSNGTLLIIILGEKDDKSMDLSSPNKQYGNKHKIDSYRRPSKRNDLYVS